LLTSRSEPHSVELREVLRPVAGPEDIILAVEAVGVCGSDLHQWTASHSWKVNYPVGSSATDSGGRIAQTGVGGAAAGSEGDRVVSETAAVIDPNSPLTREGLYNLEPTRPRLRLRRGRRDDALSCACRRAACIACPTGSPHGARGAHGALLRRATTPSFTTRACGPATASWCLGSGTDRDFVRGDGAPRRGAGGPRGPRSAIASRLEVAKVYGCEVIVGDASAWAQERDGMATVPTGVI